MADGSIHALSASLLAAALIFPAAASAQLVTKADCQAQQAAMRQMGQSEAAVAEALLPPGTEDTSSTVDVLEMMAGSFQEALQTAERYSAGQLGAREDAAGLRLMLCAYRVAILRLQATQSSTSAQGKPQPATPPRTAGAPPATTGDNKPGGFISAPKPAPRQ